MFGLICVPEPSLVLGGIPGVLDPECLCLLQLPRVPPALEERLQVAKWLASTSSSLPTLYISQAPNVTDTRRGRWTTTGKPGGFPESSKVLLLNTEIGEQKDWVFKASLCIPKLAWELVISKVTKISNSKLHKSVKVYSIVPYGFVNRNPWWSGLHLWTSIFGFPQSFHQKMRI